MSANERNWAGNITYSAARLHYPETVAQVQDVVRQSKKLRVLGSRHSFNRIADSTEDLISLAHFEDVTAVDPERRTVTVGAGVRYGELGRALYREGYALHNLASLPHISIAGACATSTHGSGDANGSLATAVSAMELVTASGDVVTVSREQNGADFDGMVVALGGLGVVTRLTLDVQPAFEMRQHSYETLPLQALYDNFDTISASAYSVSLFTDWQNQRVNQVWLKHQIVDDAPYKPAATLFAATAAPVRRHPITSLSAENCTEQLGIAGPWHERLPHFKLEFTPSSGDELQTEYIVPRQHAIGAFRALDAMRDTLAPLLQISEVRTIAADNLWMSPYYQQPCVALHFTWYNDWDAVKRLLPQLEAQLAPFDARPHWGKLFTMEPARVRSLYSRLEDFKQLLGRYDPQGKFRNAFLDTYIFGEE